MAPTAPVEERVAVGRVMRAHGIKGALRVSLYHAQSQVLKARSHITIGPHGYEITEAKPLPQPGAWLVMLTGVSSRSAAETLMGQEITVNRVELGLSSDELLVSDLIGYRVFDGAGTDHGTVASTFHQGAHEVLVLSSGLMIPFVPAWIESVDTDSQRILIGPYELT